MAGLYNSSRTRVQPVFEAAMALSREGSNGWLADLLCTAPGGRRALGSCADDPGAVLAALMAPVPASRSPRIACFEFPVPPDKRLLNWYVEHPDSLSWPSRVSFSEDTLKWRRALLDDEPPGREAAQRKARKLIENNLPQTSGWWRFEGTSSIDCVVMTDRVAITIEGKRTEPLSGATDWYPKRTQIVRNLEAARQIAGGRRWGTLVISQAPLDEASSQSVAASLDDGAPHLSDAERAELQAAYLGNVTWRQVCEVLGISYESLPKTTADLP